MEVLGEVLPRVLCEIGLLSRVLRGIGAAPGSALESVNTVECGRRKEERFP